MKKVITSALTALFCMASLFTSCSEETDSLIDPLTSAQKAQRNYEALLASKEAWVEPENYTFTYEYRYGDSLVGPEFTVVVTDGVGVCTSNCENDSSLDKFRFASISEMYDYLVSAFEQAMSASTTSKDQYHTYGISYNKDYGYPEIWDESWGTYNTCGYGGDYIRVWDFTLMNHKTYKEFCAAWQEPEKPYSFIYDIDYVADGINNVWSTGQITVTVAEDGSITRSFRNDSRENYERFLSYFGNYEIFEDGLLFDSIEDFFALGEKVWASEEKKCDSYSNYCIKPLVTTLTNEYGLKYAIEISSFLSDECGGCSLSNGEEEDSTVLKYEDYDWTRFRADIWIR